MAHGKAYVDQALTSFSQKWTNPDGMFIAEKLFPVVEVDKPSGIYWEYGKENLKKPTSTLRTGRSKTPEASFSRTQKNFGPLEEHDLKDFILWKEYKTAESPLNLEQDLTSFLNEQMSIEREVALATLMADTAIITNNTNLATTPTSQFNDYGNSDPFTVISDMITSLIKYGLRAPNTLTFGWEAWIKFVNHPDIIERIKYNQLGVANANTVVLLFADLGITQLLIGKSVYDTAGDNLTASNGFAWGKHIWLSYVGQPSLRVVNGGITLVLKGGRYVDRWTDEDEKANYIRNNDYYEQKLVGADAIALIKNAVA